MPDMLVSLLNLPDDREDIRRLDEEGVLIRRAMPCEVSVLRKFVLDSFSEAWADEVMNAFANQPGRCFIATEKRRIVGFAAYECSCRDYFGPTGVMESHRGRGIGKALLLACLRAMREMGYAYAVIGGVGPAEFYAKCVGATVIPGSTPGIYIDGLERK